MSSPKGIEVFPINPNDGNRYVWDYFNNVYTLVVPLPPGGGVWKWDYESCEEEECDEISARRLMHIYDLRLNDKDNRTQDELDVVGRATLFKDTKGRVLGFYHWDSGIVASIPEWQAVDWEKMSHTIDIEQGGAG